jgi:DNA polymerase-3 subunit gamma/tau
MDLLLETIQYLAIAQISPESLLDIDARKEEIILLSNLLTLEEVQILYQIGLLAKRDMDLAPNIASGFEMALLRMLAFVPKNKEIDIPKKKPNKSITASKEQVEESLATDLEDKSAFKNHRIKKDMESKETNLLNPEPELVKEDSPENESSIVNIKLDRSSWNDTFKLLDLDLGTKQLASHCSFVRTDDSIIYLSMPEEKLDLFSGKHRQRLQESVSNFLGSECNLFFESGEGPHISPNTIKTAERNKIKNDAEKAIKEDPNVKILLDSLGGKVVDSSIEPWNSE